jgi:hypothetical protein
MKNYNTETPEVINKKGIDILVEEGLIPPKSNKYLERASELQEIIEYKRKFLKEYLPEKMVNLVLNDIEKVAALCSELDTSEDKNNLIFMVLYTVVIAYLENPFLLDPILTFNMALINKAAEIGPKKALQEIISEMKRDINQPKKRERKKKEK